MTWLDNEGSLSDTQIHNTLHVVEGNLEFYLQQIQSSLDKKKWTLFYVLYMNFAIYIST